MSLWVSTEIIDALVRTMLFFGIVPATGVIVMAVAAAYDVGGFRRTGNARLLELVNCRSSDEWDALTEAQRTKLRKSARLHAECAREDPYDQVSVASTLAVGPKKASGLAKKLRTRAARLTREAIADLDALLAQVANEPLMRAHRLASRRTTRLLWRIRWAALAELGPRTAVRLLKRFGFLLLPATAIACLLLLLPVPLEDTLGFSASLTGPFAALLFAVVPFAALIVTISMAILEALSAQADSPRRRRLAVLLGAGLPLLVVAGSIYFTFGRRELTSRYLAAPAEPHATWLRELVYVFALLFLAAMLFSFFASARDGFRDSSTPWSERLSRLATVLFLSPALTFMILAVAVLVLEPTAVERADSAPLLDLDTSAGRVTAYAYAVTVFFIAPTFAVASRIARSLERRTRRKRAKQLGLPVERTTSPWLIAAAWAAVTLLLTLTNPWVLRTVDRSSTDPGEALWGLTSLYWLVTLGFIILGTPVALVWCVIAALRQRRTDQRLAAEVSAHMRGLDQVSDGDIGAEGRSRRSQVEDDPTCPGL